MMGGTLAAEEINAAGGILGSKIEVKFMDTELKADVAVKNARYLVTDWGADFLAGIDSSGVVMAMGPVAEELKTIFIATHGATQRFTEELVYEKGMKHNFRISVPIYQDAILGAQVFKDKKEIKRIANIGADYEYGRVGWQMFVETLKKYNPDVEVVGEAWAPFLTVDFAPHISAVMAKEPDLIFSTPWAGEGVQLLKQALLMGVFDKVDYWWQAMGGSVDLLEGVTREVQADKFKGKLWATARYIHNWPDTPENKKFVDSFQQRWSRFPNYSAQTTYSAVYAIKQVLEQTKTLDVQTNIKALESLEMMTPGGKLKMRAEDHQAIVTVPAGRIVADPKYPIAVLGDLVVVPAEQYYRNPPFK
jgi:branched-chain amino acid transport system substrate-binding protein